MKGGKKTLPTFVKKKLNLIKKKSLVKLLGKIICGTAQADRQGRRLCLTGTFVILLLFKRCLWIVRPTAFFLVSEQPNCPRDVSPCKGPPGLPALWHQSFPYLCVPCSLSSSHFGIRGRRLLSGSLFCILPHRERRSSTWYVPLQPTWHSLRHGAAPPIRMKCSLGTKWTGAIAVRSARARPSSYQQVREPGWPYIVPSWHRSPCLFDFLTSGAASFPVASILCDSL